MEILCRNETERSIEMLDEMRQIWYDDLNYNLVSIAFVQSKTDAYVELSFTDENGDITIQATNLDFISGEEEQEFDPKNDITENARRFIKLDRVSLTMCIDGIFDLLGGDARYEAYLETLGSTEWIDLMNEINELMYEPFKTNLISTPVIQSETVDPIELSVKNENGNSTTQVTNLDFI